VHPGILPRATLASLCKIAQHSRQNQPGLSRQAADPLNFALGGLQSSFSAKGRPVKNRGKASFDPKTFLAKVGEGKTIIKYRKDEIVFSQGEIADAVFYIQKGKIKLSVVSEQGKEAVVAILAPGQFFG
jgi:CRP-like cAMP-binding protein